MKISILCENQTGEDQAKTCLSEWGLSLYIETQDKRILFDAGHTDIFAKNAQAMNIDIEQCDVIILSHYHWDHIEGLFHYQFKKRKDLICHPDLIQKCTQEERTYLEQYFHLILSKEALKLNEQITFLGEIPRKTLFEKGKYKDLPMREDSALAIKTSKGCVVISGCSHSGIVNICEQAKKVTQQNLNTVLGGFHLFKENRETISKTIEYFKNEKVIGLYPIHCIDLPTLVTFYETFQIKKLCTGDCISISE